MTEEILCVIPVNPHERPPNAPEYNPGDNMVHIKCEKCEKLSWIGPKQIEKKQSEPQILVLCLTCIFNEMQKNPIKYDIEALE